MAEKSNIEWTDGTFNPWRGCSKISPGCWNCYADLLSERNPSTLGIWGPGGTRIVASDAMWKQPLVWNRELFRECPRCHWRGSTDCQRCKLVWGEMIPARRRVFCASLADVFEDWHKEMRYPATDEETKKPSTSVAWYRPGKGIVKAGQISVNLSAGERHATMQDARDQLFTLIEDTPNIDYLLLTKRPENVLRMVPEKWRDLFPTNVWMGTSAENQAMADKRIPELLKIPALVRFLSCEPLLGPLDLHSFTPFNVSHGVTLPESCRFWGGIHWVIAGGESGPNARPMHPAWAIRLRDQCQSAGVSFLFKQWGNWFPRSQWEFNPDLVLPDDSVAYTPEEGKIAIFEGNEVMHNIGKHKAGRLLNGKEHNGYPHITQIPA